MGIFKYVKSLFKKEEPLVMSNPISKVDLKHKTKKELEKMGRDLGIELDRRLTKDKLIKQIKELI